MKLELQRFRRALLLNKSMLPDLLPLAVYRMTRTPRFGMRARNILFALEFLRQCSSRKRIVFDSVAEFGVAAGEGFRQLVILTMHFCAAHRVPTPRFFGFDSFEGLHPSDHPADRGAWDVGDYRGDYAELSRFINEMGWSQFCELVPGYFSETLPKLPDTFAPQFIMVDCDYYTSTRDIFIALKDRLVSGTVVYFDDLGTQFFNRSCGEERLIHEVNTSQLGPAYHLEKLWDRCYVWSNADRPPRKTTEKSLSIPLRRDNALGDFY